MTHPSVADAELADLIRATERERLRALAEADMVVAEQLHADDFQLINPFGGTATKAEYLEDIASGETNYLVFEPDCEIAVHLYGGAVAIRYISRIEIIVSGTPFHRATTGTPMFTNSMRVCGKPSGLKQPKSSNGHAEGSKSGHANTASPTAVERSATRPQRVR